MNFYTSYVKIEHGQSMDTKVSYAGILRRVSACAIDGVLWMIIALVSLLFLNYDVNDISTHRIILMATLLITYIVFNILTITKYGCTPGRLLCGVRIKDANTFKSVTLMQATIRCISEAALSFVFLFLIDYVSQWFAILPILVFIFAIFDQRKQFLHDKIAKTVVIDYKPS